MRKACILYHKNAQKSLLKMTILYELYVRYVPCLEINMETSPAACGLLGIEYRFKMQSNP